MESPCSALCYTESVVTKAPTLSEFLLFMLSLAARASSFPSASKAAVGCMSPVAQEKEVPCPLSQKQKKKKENLLMGAIITCVRAKGNWKSGGILREFSPLPAPFLLLSLYLYLNKSMLSVFPI